MAPPRAYCVLQVDDRSAAELGWQHTLREHNRATCDALDRCTYVDADAAPGVSPYWQKVHALRQCVRRGGGCDACVYLDSDAVLNVGDAAQHFGGVDDFEALLRGKDVAYAPDAGSRSRMNAGVVAVAATDAGRAVLDDWLALEPTAAWSREPQTGEWRCADAEGADCAWAGLQYEQGSFIAHLADRHMARTNEASSTLWQSDTLDCNGTVKHFMGSYGGLGKQQAIERYLQRCPLRAPVHATM
jgi:hypothetical protein